MLYVTIFFGVIFFLFTSLLFGSIAVADEYRSKVFGILTLISGAILVLLI